MTIGEWCRIGKQHDLDGIDISIMFVRYHTPKYLGELRNELQNQDIQLVMVTSYPDFTHPDPIQRNRELDYLKRDIALSSFLGAKYVRIVAGQAHRGVAISKGVNWVVEYFKQASRTGEKYGVQLLYENHSKPGAWLYPDFSYPTEVFLDIVSRIAETSIRINFDTANFIAYGDDPLPILEQVIDKIETVHAADTEKKGAFIPVLLGKGVVPFQKIFRRLKQNGFNKWICIEEASNSGTSGLADAVSFVRRSWEDV
jgi:sugar phosphate isomerase/epimerase